MIFNSFVLQQQKYYVYADVLVLPGLTIKMLACLLAALGVYAASEIDYVKLYNFLIDRIENVKYLGAIAKNTIVNRVIPRVKGIYEDVMDWISSLDISNWFEDIRIGETAPYTVNSYGIVPDNFTVELESNKVWQVGNVIFKSVKRDWVSEPTYDIYYKQSIDMTWWEMLTFVNSDSIIYKVKRSWDDYIIYDLYYYDEWLQREVYTDAAIGVETEYVPYETIPGDPVDVRIRKVRDIGLENDVVGVIVDGYYTGEYETWQEYLEYLNSIESVNSSWLERLVNEYDVGYTDVITPEIGLERIPLEELESYPVLPGVDEPIDIPLNPSLPGDIPIGDIVIPDEQVLDEPIPDDTVIPGIGLIARLLRYIANAIKMAIVVPLNAIKEGVIFIYNLVRDIPLYIGVVVDTIREIPGQVVDVVENWYNRVLEKMREIGEKLGTLPQQIAEAIEGLWSGVREKVGDIADAIEGFWSDVIKKVGEIADYVVAIPGQIAEALGSFWSGVREKIGEIADYVVAIPGQVVEGVTGVIDDVKEWFEGLLIPTLELDFTPLQVGTIKEKFPFSLPWDIQRMIGQLIAEPQVPRWEANILGNELVIDFEIFEPLALIVRWAVVIMFIVGLIKFYTILL